MSENGKTESGKTQRTFMRRLYSWGTVLLVSVLFLSACTGPEMGTLERKSQAEECAPMTDLTLLIDETTVSCYGDMIDEMKLEFPEYQIHSVEWNQLEVEKAVKTAMTRDESLEVVKWFPNQMENFIASQAAMDLTPYLDGEWKNIWEDWALDIGTYGGRVYCLPSVAVYPVLEVNEAILDMAGVTAEEEWTWAEFVNACERIKRYTGVYPFGIRDTRVCWFMRNALLQIWDDKEEMKRFQAGGVSFYDPRVTEAFDRIDGLFRSDYAYPGQGAFSQTNEQVKAAFERGEIAMMFNVNNSVPESLERMKAVGWQQIRVISFPTMAAGDCDFLLGGCEGFFIPANTKHPDEAIRLLKFLTSSRIFTELRDQGFAVPARLGDDGERKITSDLGRVYSQELMNLSSKLYNYINYELPAAYYMDRDNALREAEAMRLEAVREKAEQ